MAHPKILIVEDETIVAIDIQERLKSLGYTVVGRASSAEAAVKKAKEERPDLVLMDILLKGNGDGIEAAREIRERFDIPVIYLTAYGDPKTLDRAKVTEPLGYILKPFEERELNITIEMALYKHQMEQKLREREAWLQTTLQSIGDAVIATDRKGDVVFMNSAAESLTGWTQEEALDKDLREVFRLLDASHSPLENLVEKVLQEGKTLHLTSPGLLLTRKGAKIPIDDAAAPIADNEGNRIGVVLVFRDITERERTQEDLRQKTEELERSNKELQQFAFVASHDLQEPLLKILAFGDRLKELSTQKLDEREQDYVGRMQKAALRMRQLIDDLLQFARITTKAKPFERVDLNQVVKEVLSDLEMRIAKTQARIEVENLPTLEGDPRQLHQLFQNLISNALKFSKKGECPDIAIKSRVLPKGFTEIVVEDKGIGFEEKYLERIFEPFQRLHSRSEYEGTGMGLAICQKIVQIHHGEITAKSRLGVGSTFSIKLPVKET